MTSPSGTDTQEQTDAVPEKTAVEMFDEECRKGLVMAKKQLPTLLSLDGVRTVENLLVPYNEMLTNAVNSSGTAGLMKEVHPDAKIREAGSKCSEEVSAFLSSLGRNRELFDAFSALDMSKLEGDDKRFVEHSLRDFRRAGVDKDDATRARLKAIDDELTKLSNDFGKNVREDVRSIKVKPEELAGMPADWIAQHPAGKDGMVTVTTDYPDYIPFNSFAESTERRRELYLLFKSRADKSNEPILKDVLTLRAEKAKILGYSHWADYITEDKMVGSAKNAKNFIQKVTRSASKKARKDYRELLAMKRKKIDRKAKLVEDYEKAYIENLLKKDKYAFDAKALRPYFPYKAVQKGLLDITATMYEIRYEKVADAKVWHQDVSAFDVFAANGGEKLGRIVLDMHAREGKYKHAAQFPYRNGVKGMQMPEGVLVCNFPNPRTDGAALMVHDQVETMFHEFGHLMHHVLGGQQRWLEQSGVATERDFVEAPSQMFEEWAQNYDTLSTFAKHHETGEVIPKELVASMNKASKFGLGTWALQQMFYASVSLGFHTADPAKLDMKAQVKKLQNDITPFRYLDNTAFHTNFGHLIGYSAYYYTYMWSLVIAQDLLTPFKKAGLGNEAWLKKYRDSILVPGGTADAADLVETFLGRKFNYRAFEKFLGR